MKFKSGAIGYVRSTVSPKPITLAKGEIDGSIENLIGAALFVNESFPVRASLLIVRVESERVVRRRVCKELMKVVISY